MGSGKVTLNKKNPWRIFEHVEKKQVGDETRGLSSGWVGYLLQLTICCGEISWRMPVENRGKDIHSHI